MDPNSTITYDDSEFRKLCASLDARRVGNGLRNAYRSSGKKIADKAKANLTGSSVHNAKKLSRTFRVRILKKGAGFQVTGSSGKGNRHFHTNRRGLRKPVLLFLELGASARATRGTGRRRAHSTGDLFAVGGGGEYLKRAIESETGRVRDELRDEVFRKIREQALRYGCQ